MPNYVRLNPFKQGGSVRTAVTIVINIKINELSLIFSAPKRCKKVSFFDPVRATGFRQFDACVVKEPDPISCPKPTIHSTQGGFLWQAAASVNDRFGLASLRGAISVQSGVMIASAKKGAAR